MSWQLAAAALVAEIDQDAVIVALLGGQHVYRANAVHPRQVPSIEWERRRSLNEESEGRLEVSLHIWAKSYDAAVAIESRLDEKLKRTGVFLLNEEYSVRSLEEESETVEVPDPEPEVIHFVCDFTFKHERDPILTGAGTDTPEYS